MDEEDMFFENFGHPAEKEDMCLLCQELGVLEEPYACFFYTLYENGTDYTVAMMMELNFVESLTRLIKNAQEEGGTAKEKIYLASDEMCGFFDKYHVFGIGDFEGNWEFDLHPFNERNKVAIVGPQGVCLSCDISTKGDNEQDLGTVRTCWFSLEDLAALNGWLVERLDD